MNRSYELIFSGVKDPHPQTLQRVKAALIGELNLSIDEVKNLLSGEQTVICESQDSLILNKSYDLLIKSGAKVSIVEKSNPDIDTVDVSLSTLALEDNLSEPLFPKVVQPERLLSSEEHDDFGDLTIDTSSQTSEPPPVFKAASEAFDLSIAREEPPAPMTISSPVKTIAPTVIKQEPTPPPSFSFSLEEPAQTPPTATSPAQKSQAIKDTLSPQPSPLSFELSLEATEPPHTPSPHSPTPVAPQAERGATPSAITLSVEDPPQEISVVTNNEPPPSAATPAVELRPPPVVVAETSVVTQPSPPSPATPAAVQPLTEPTPKVEEVFSSSKNDSSLGILPLFLGGLALLVISNIAYKSFTDNSAADEAIIGQSIVAALKPNTAGSKVDKKAKKSDPAPSGVVYIPPTQFIQTAELGDKKSFAADLSFREEHLSGTIEFNDKAEYVPDIERIKARLAPVPIVSKLFIELNDIPVDPIRHTVRWTGPAAVSLTVGQLKTRRVGSVEFVGNIEGEKFIGTVAVVLNLDSVSGEPVAPTTTPEGQITFRVVQGIEASKIVLEAPPEVERLSKADENIT